MATSTLVDVSEFTCTLSTESNTIIGSLEPNTVFEVGGVIDIPKSHEDTYEEEYVVQMSLIDDVVLHTKGKYLSDDITINPVGMTTVSNESGGHTLCIGG